MHRLSSLPEGVRGAIAIVVLVALASVVTRTIAAAAGSPYTLWFPDTLVMLLAVLGYLVIITITWDNSLVALGAAIALIGRIAGRRKASVLAFWRRFGFFSASPFWSLFLLLMTAYAVLQTGNVTLINLTLLNKGVTHWRDAALWSIEEPLFRLFPHSGAAVEFFDWLYHTSWGVMLALGCLLSAAERRLRLLIHYCVAMIITYYCGRLVGTLDPVMGPAFYRPEQFQYVSDSITWSMMQSIARSMALAPDDAMRSGILVGGVAAMPSLHLAQVTVTAWWAGRWKTWTALLSIPWIALIWISTIVLGWHYALDGLGGIVLGLLCVYLARQSLRLLGFSDRRPGEEGVPGTQTTATADPSIRHA